jgi:MoaA/NifB/PqqE/SkfB family radical SAM enzyme
MNYSPFRHLPSVLWKRRPIQLTFFVTGRCNARCPFCFYVDTPRPAPLGAAELSIEEIGRVAGSLGTLQWLAFSGGEPFLRRDLAEIARVFYRQNRPAILLLPTNGLMPELIRDRTAQILADCPRTVVVVKLSLDGIGGLHDRLRATPGAFERVMQTYRLLAPLLQRHRNFELGINTVFLADNQNEMEQIITYVEQLAHIRMHTISLVRGNLADSRFKQIDPQTYRRTIERLESGLKRRTASTYRFGGARLKAAQDIVQRRLILRTWVDDARQIPCYAGRINLVLTETGELHPCEMLAASMGNVRAADYDVPRLLSSQRSRSIVQGIADARCHCTHECNFITNILFNPRCYPALANEYWRLPGPIAAAPRGPDGTTHGVPTARAGS